MEELVTQIIKVEKEIFKERNRVSKKSKFRNISADFWIKNLDFPFKFYTTLSLFPMIRLFPANIYFWINNLKVFFGNKLLTGYGYKNMIGHIFLWPFSKSYSAELEADAFYLKRKNKYVVLFYVKNESSVIKVNLSLDNYNRFKRQITNEIESQLMALELVHDVVRIPKIKSFNLDSDTLFLEQEFLNDYKEIRHLSKKNKQIMYDKVFDFMFNFYIKSGIKGVKLDTDLILGLLEDFQKHFYENKEMNLILSRFKTLLQQEKLIFWCKIHKDLNSQNILFDKNKNLSIIDWGLSKYYYWADEVTKHHDFHESTINKIYNRILDYLKYSPTEVYNLHQQRFLVCCFNFISEMNNLYKHNKLEKHKMDVNITGFLQKLKFFNLCKKCMIN